MAHVLVILLFLPLGVFAGIIALIAGVISFLAITSENSGHTAGFGDGLAAIGFGAVSLVAGFVSVTCLGLAGLFS